ncbi:MAG: hypothetical protein CMK49_02840 [Prochlorococcus sp. SP3034]|nr:hypothetical protein [Prochlorococcus sp. SP3034]|tara:strand:- start:6086 stop:6706 length:621 start_codon:yes stop_codon:yes gene_type:complete
MYLLPKDFNSALSDMEKAVIENLNSSNKNRLTIEFRFEGIKFNKIGIKLFEIINKENLVYITFSDPGAVALAKRDYPNIKDKILSYKSFNESELKGDNELILISMLPQPYDFDSFEPMCENFKGTHISLNPKFEDANIGIGSVIRERRKNFINTWNNIYYLQPLNNGALMHISPNNWALFKSIENKYYFVKDFESKPDNETIFLNL